MNEPIAISQLNDFIFCPYSIYLHNVYMESDESLYHASPQVKGKIAHETIDDPKASAQNRDMVAITVWSETLQIYGKIDIYRASTQTLIERKYILKQIFRGQLYQLWAQYFCMKEMGYDVKRLAFYESSTHKTYPISLPNEQERKELEYFIASFRRFNPSQPITVNPNKCRHCIYCSLCDKTSLGHVYE